MPTTRPAHTVEQESAAMSERHARNSAIVEACDVQMMIGRILTDLNAGRVPSSSDVRVVGTAATDLARGVGLLTAYAEARKLLNDDRVQ